jgi:hypothetical protein
VRLPRSNPVRRADGFLQLLADVDLYAPRGLQFSRRQLLTPGAEFDPQDLPRPAVLIEYTGPMRFAPARSRYSFTPVWILWRFDFDASKWIEVVRMACRDSSWSLHFAPIAHRLLHPLPEAPVEERGAPAAERIAGLIRAALEPLSRELRCSVLGQLDLYIANEIVAACADISLRTLPAGDGGRVWPRLGGQRGREPGVLGPPRIL